MADPEGLRGYDSVRTWLRAASRTTLAPAAPAEEGRLQTLADFLTVAGVDPDTLIERSRDTAPNGRAVRDDYLRLLKRWVSGTTGTIVQQVRQENAVRGFFIANGIRVRTKPYPDVYHRGPGRPGGGVRP